MFITNSVARKCQSGFPLARLTYMHRGRMPRICCSRLRRAGQLGLYKAVKTWLLQSNAVNRKDLASHMPALRMMYLKLTHPKDPNLR